MPEFTEQEQRAQLERLETIGADVKRFREEHPESQLASAAFQLAGLVGKLQAAVAAAPIAGDRKPQGWVDPEGVDFQDHLRAIERGESNG